MRDLYCVLKVDNETIARYALVSFPGPTHSSGSGLGTRLGVDMVCPFLTSFPYHMLMEWNEKQGGESLVCPTTRECLVCGHMELGRARGRWSS